MSLEVSFLLKMIIIHRKKGLQYLELCKNGMFLHIILCWDLKINDVLIYKYPYISFCCKMSFFQPKHGTVPEISFLLRYCRMWEDWNLRRCFVPRKAYYLIVHLRFKGRWAVSLTWPEYDAGREGLHVTAALGSLCLGREWGGGISHIRGTAAASERAAALGTTSGFRLGQRKAHLPCFLPFCPGHLAASLRAAHRSWLDVWESSEHSPSRLRNSADLYDNKSNG